MSVTGTHAYGKPVIKCILNLSAQECMTHYACGKQPKLIAWVHLRGYFNARNYYL